MGVAAGTLAGVATVTLTGVVAVTFAGVAAPAGSLMTCPGTMTLVRVKLFAVNRALNDTFAVDAIFDNESLRCTT